MRSKVILALVIVAAFAGSFAGQRALERRHVRGSDAGKLAANGALRIVSLAPSITEVLFAVGAGGRVVGVTSYCRYPPEARGITQIGAQFGTNYEAIVALKPDLVITIKEQEEKRTFLHALDIRTMSVDHGNVSGILESIRAVGEACGRSREAQLLVGELTARTARVRGRTRGLPSPAVMVALGRDMGTGTLSDVFIAGNNGFHSDLIRLAGGVNVYEDRTLPVPTVSGEAVLRMDPEVIFEMTGDLSGQDITPAKILADWQDVAEIDAVRNNRVHVIDQDYAMIPGPRFIILLEEMARLVHPGVNWDGEDADD